MRLVPQTMRQLCHGQGPIYLHALLVYAQGEAKEACAVSVENKGSYHSLLDHMGVAWHRRPVVHINNNTLDNRSNNLRPARMGEE